MSMNTPSLSLSLRAYVGFHCAPGWIVGVHVWAGPSAVFVVLVVAIFFSASSGSMDAGVVPSEGTAA